MKKLKFLAGGQPFRSTDFEVIQNAMLLQFNQVLSTFTSVPAIISGMIYYLTGSEVADAPFTVPEGYFYDLQEICHVPSATFNYNATKTLYLRLSVVDSSQRLVGGANQYVMTERMYNLVYTTAPLAGDIVLFTAKRISILGLNSFQLIQDAHPVELMIGYVATIGAGLYCFSNNVNERMIVCTFTASTSAGTLAKLPDNMKPMFDTIGYFRAGNTIAPLVIRSSGNVELTGAVTSGSNIVAFKYNVSITLSL